MIDFLELKISFTREFFHGSVYLGQKFISRKGRRGAEGSRRVDFHAKSLPAAAEQRGKERNGCNVTQVAAAGSELKKQTGKKQRSKEQWAQSSQYFIKIL